MHDNCFSFYQKPEFTTCPEEEVVKRQQFTRGKLSVSLFFDRGRIFTFQNAGTVGAVLRKSPNLYDTLERSIQYVFEHHIGTPSNTTCVINNVNPFILGPSSVAVQFDVKLGVSMKIRARVAEFRRAREEAVAVAAKSASTPKAAKTSASSPLSSAQRG